MKQTWCSSQWQTRIRMPALLTHWVTLTVIAGGGLSIFDVPAGEIGTAYSLAWRNGQSL
ncbi:hypothetical protein ABK905_12470 [Acerihabitans sp. KWT182]|uniref:Uncharacterized protein n=1 Tax=Acerihabitans sp. KWT182 TaxID=3157919 RepID=A0AAU7QF07_9GAMM